MLLNLRGSTKANNYKKLVYVIDKKEQRHV